MGAVSRHGLRWHLRTVYSTMQSGRGRSRLPRKKSSAAGSAISAAAATKPAVDAQAKRARSKLPPLPYGARVTGKPTAGKAAADAGSGSDMEDDDDDDDDADQWDDTVAADASAAAAVAASMAAEEREELDNAKHGIKKGTLSAVERAAAKEKAAKELARKKRLHTSMVNKQYKDKYELHVTLICAMQLRMDDAANSEILQAYGLSLVPSDAVVASNSSETSMETLRRFVLWFRFAYQVERLVTGQPVRRKCSVEDRVLDCILKRRGDILDLVVLAAAALRATGRRCRIVIPMQPLSFKPPPKSAALKNNTGRAVVSSIVDHTKLAGLYAWVEVFVNGRWVHVDPTAGLVDAANEKDIGRLVHLLDSQHANVPPIENSAPAPGRRQKNAKPAAPVRSLSRRGGTTMADMRARRQTRVVADKISFAHVVAVENSALSDVTRRYIAAWVDAKKERHPSGLFEKVLDRCCRHYGRWAAKLSREIIVVPNTKAEASRIAPLQPAKTANTANRRVYDLESSDVLPEDIFTGFAADKVVDMAVTSEQLEFDRRALKETVPTTIGSLRNHPTYVLERHLKKYEVVYPREPIVASAGPEKEHVFLRSHVRQLHTRDIWYRKMRSVKEDAEAVKQVSSKTKRNVDGIMLGSESDLFGEWQTDALVIEAVKNGIVSRGPRGNVELWTPEHLPKGSTHVPGAHSASAARKLGFDFVPCMTGFDVRSGRSFPRIDGIVVAEEFADIVRDAAIAHGTIAEEEAQKRLREEALSNWSDLLTRVRSRLAVTLKYGNGEDGLLSAAQGSSLAGENSGTAEAVVQSGLGTNKRSIEKVDLTSDAEEGENLKRSKPSGSALALDGHDHQYDDGRHHEGDVWVKVCKICGMEVAFEKL